ncbi:MAG: OmpA family protein [Vampirovibrionales bacterium]
MMRSQRLQTPYSSPYERGQQRATAVMKARLEGLSNSSTAHHLQGHLGASTGTSPSHPLQKLERLEEDLGNGAAYTGPHRWLIPYADLLTLLLGVFLALLALAARDNTWLNQLNQELQAHLTQSQAVVAAQAKQLETYKALEKTVHQMALNAHNPQAIAIHQTQEGILIRLADSLLFDSGSAHLSTQAKQALAPLAQGLKNHAHPIRIEGHTDNTPIATAQYPSNWALSTGRATALVAELIEHHQMNPQQLSAVGYAEFRPIASNSSAQGRQKNRRVDIIVLDSSKAESDLSDSPPRVSSPTSPIVTPLDLNVEEASPDAHPSLQ